MRPSVAIFAVISALTACSGGGKITGAKFDDIAGTYTGEFAFQSTFTLTIAQSDSSFSGTYTASGFLHESTGAPHKVSYAGSLTGALNPGSFPRLGMALLIPGCPGYRALFSGVYDSAAHRMIISGPIDAFADNTCTVVLTQLSVIPLSR